MTTHAPRLWLENGKVRTVCGRFVRPLRISWALFTCQVCQVAVLPKKKRVRK